MSLRARLIALVLAVAAAGLLAVDLVSYAALRAYLSDRVDDQLSSAFAPAADELARRGGGEPFAFGGDTPGLPGPADGPPAGTGEPPDGMDGGQPPPGAGGPPPGGDMRLAPGTFAELRTSDGEPIGDPIELGFGGEASDLPELPADLPVSEDASELDSMRFDSEDGESFEVAAIAEQGDGGRVLIAAVPLEDSRDTLSRLLAIVAVVSAAVLVAIGSLAYWVVGLALRPLRRIETTAREIAAGDLERRASDTGERTEVGRLGRAFNEMVDRLGAALAESEASESRLRRFLADASHELRTPLSSIRGYAELFRLGGTRDTEQLELAMARIEGESERMGVLIGDLLALARTGEEREQVREPLDLGEVATELVADARVAAPGRELSVAVEGSPTLLGDPEQVRRAASNLIRNALVHTPAGTPVEVSVAERGGGVELRVRDHGPGIEPGAERRIFERFWRSSDDAARSTREGSGLGLAIVAAIAEAHGGRASARNADGAGAEFRLWLPSESA